MVAKLWTYLPSTPGSALRADPVFYGRLARETGRRTSVDGFVVPIRSGRAWPVRAGQLCRIVVVEGAQVADFNCWNLHNPRERFWAARTKQLHRAHVTTFDRLWSTLPYLRPMLTITNDTVQYSAGIQKIEAPPPSSRPAPIATSAHRMGRTMRRAYHRVQASPASRGCRLRAPPAGSAGFIFRYPLTSSPNRR
jgi:hypothetical protein